MPSIRKPFLLWAIGLGAWLFAMAGAAAPPTGAQEEVSAPGMSSAPDGNMAEESAAVAEFEAEFLRVFSRVMADPRPRRFGGWFRPASLGLILGLPTIVLLVSRRHDLVRAMRATSRGRSEGGDP
ncbi:MAG: hypothetical protein JW797_19370 [Bradymonadales bacterium]|nr:hypothetical protein [Bradymonadales bacterium]